MLFIASTAFGIAKADEAANDVPDAFSKFKTFLKVDPSASSLKEPARGMFLFWERVARRANGVQAFDSGKTGILELYSIYTLRGSIICGYLTGNLLPIALKITERGSGAESFFAPARSNIAVPSLFIEQSADDIRAQGANANARYTWTRVVGMAGETVSFADRLEFVCVGRWWRVDFDSFQGIFERH